jgi:hypothetical protein
MATRARAPSPAGTRGPARSASTGSRPCPHAPASADAAPPVFPATDVRDCAWLLVFPATAVDDSAWSRRTRAGGRRCTCCARTPRDATSLPSSPSSECSSPRRCPAPPRQTDSLGDAGRARAGCVTRARRAAAGRQPLAAWVQDEDGRVPLHYLVANPRVSKPVRPPPPSRTIWTRLVPPSVLTGHVSSEKDVPPHPPSPSRRSFLPRPLYTESHPHSAFRCAEALL